MRPALLLIATLLAAPALAQGEIEARMNECMAGIDLDAVSTRAEGFAAAHDYQARIDDLCAAGDIDGAAEFARGVEAAFYAADAEGAKMKACLKEILGDDLDTSADEVCLQ